MSSPSIIVLNLILGLVIAITNCALPAKWDVTICNRIIRNIQGNNKEIDFRPEL